MTYNFNTTGVGNNPYMQKNPMQQSTGLYRPNMVQGQGYGNYPQQNYNMTQFANSFMEQQQMQQQMDFGCKFVNSYSEAQSFPVMINGQAMLMNMNEDEFYIKTKGENGKDILRIFTFNEKDKPKEIEAKEQDKQTIDTLVEQMGIVQKKLDSVVEFLNKGTATISTDKQPVTTAVANTTEKPSYADKPIFNGGK